MHRGGRKIKKRYKKKNERKTTWRKWESKLSKRGKGKRKREWKEKMRKGGRKVKKRYKKKNDRRTMWRKRGKQTG